MAEMIFREERTASDGTCYEVRQSQEGSVIHTEVFETPSPPGVCVTDPGWNYTYEPSWLRRVLGATLEGDVLRSRRLALQWVARQVNAINRVTQMVRVTEVTEMIRKGAVGHNPPAGMPPPKPISGVTERRR
jgi:hypothetical protein